MTDCLLHFYAEIIIFSILLLFLSIWPIKILPKFISLKHVLHYLCSSSMNLGKTWMGHMFKKVIELEKKDNVGVNNKNTSLIKKIFIKFFFSI